MHADTFSYIPTYVFSFLFGVFNQLDVVNHKPTLDHRSGPSFSFCCRQETAQMVGDTVPSMLNVLSARKAKL